MQLSWVWEPTFVEIIQTKDPSVVIIVETWANEARFDRTLSIITFDQKWVVPRTARGGRLNRMVVEGGFKHCDVRFEVERVRSGILGFTYFGRKFF